MDVEKIDGRGLSMFGVEHIMSTSQVPAEVKMCVGFLSDPTQRNKK